MPTYCTHENCKKCPNFNFKGEKRAIFCSKHKLENMVDIKSKTCEFEDCDIQPTFNFKGEKQAKFCSKHKLENMVDIKHKTCKSDWCDILQNPRYDGYCLFCYINLFPDKPVARNYKTKEKAVTEFIKINFENFTWICDKRIDNGCSMRRPDLLLDLGYQVIIVEVDENQHTDYDCSCENKRLMQLSLDINHRPIIFIRFNPDEYINEEGNKVKSCWSINSKGIYCVNKTQISNWNDRLSSLYTQIEYWINPINRTDKMVEVVQLFYDKL